MLDPVLTILLQDVQASLGHLHNMHLIYSHFNHIVTQVQLFGSVPQPIFNSQLYYLDSTFGLSPTGLAIPLA